LAENYHQFFVEGDVWHYSVSGSGKRPMILLHGYGQNSSVFHYLEALLETQYYFIKIDLAYHGNNDKMSDSFIFNREYCEGWLLSLRQELDIIDFSITGFSIGARIAMGIVSWFPQHISELWLIAPDGLPVSKAYKFLSQTSLGVILFRSFVSKPWLALALIYTGKKLSILSERTAKFYMHEIGTIEKRQQLYNTWMAYRELKPNYKLLSELNEKKSFSLSCYLGKDDSIIPIKRTQKFILKHLKGAQIVPLGSGHNILSEKGIKRLKEYWEE
jgi:pimeloyl-ACP methyl ester carboxylesterase